MQLTAPRLGTRLALGIETPLAHAVVDRLLGFDRSFGESRLQLTPVEWGVWSFLVLPAARFAQVSRAADRQDRAVDPELLEPGDLTLDRVGPDQFDPTDLGSIVTIRWSVHMENITSSVRLWIAESVVRQWSASFATPTVVWPRSALSSQGPELLTGANFRIPPGELSSAWSCDRGTCVHAARAETAEGRQRCPVCRSAVWSARRAARVDLSTSSSISMIRTYVFAFKLAPSPTPAAASSAWMPARCRSGGREIPSPQPKL